MTETESVVTTIECRSCGTQYSPDISAFPCENCGGFLDPIYDIDALDIDRETLDERNGSMWKYRELLPIRDTAAVSSLGEGSTPLIDCQSLAERMGIGRLWIKDEGQNPTNTFKDRGASVTMSGLLERGIDEAGIISVGNAGQAAAAYAARAGITCHIYLTEDRGKIATTLMEAHGAEMHYGTDFISTKERMDRDQEKHGWTPLAPFNAPFRHEGKKTMGLELFSQLNWDTPDHIVYPTGGGVGIVGIWKAYQHYSDLGWLDGANTPTINPAQTTGCAPIVRALEDGAEEHTPWDEPKSIARGVMNPDPAASRWILECVRASGGTGVAVEDRDAVDASLEVLSTEGVEMGVTSSVALAGATELAERGEFDEEDEVVVINTGAACKSVDELRAELGMA